MPAKHRTDVSWGSGELLEWLQRYVSRKGTTISAFCQDHAKQVRAKDERRLAGNRD